MIALLSLAASALLALIGCQALALSQQRHWSRVMSTAPTPRTAKFARRIGWAAILLSLAISIGTEGPGFAALLWPLFMAAGAFIVALTIAYAPGRYRPRFGP